MSEPSPEAKQAAECPFCGGVGVLLSTGDIPRYAEVWVQCNECGAQGPRFPHYDRDKLGSDKAWAVWRKRADKLREELLHMTQSRDQWKDAFMELETEQETAHAKQLAHQQPSAITADVEKLITKESALAYFKQFLNGDTGMASAKVLADVMLTVQRQARAPLVEEAFDKLRAILKDRSKGEVDTWGFVAMFMDMIDEAEAALTGTGEKG